MGGSGDHAEDGSRAGGGPLIFLVAGEPSGDLLGGRLMAALREAAGGAGAGGTGGGVSFAGIGGEAMAAQGLESLFPMEELSVMGLVEVLPRVPRLLRRLKETFRAVRRERPDAVVTIDAPGFNFRLAGRLKSDRRTRDIPIVHYVAPQVWAWRPGRARKIASVLDHLLTLLPFEPPYFEVEGLASTYVGHPAVESGGRSGDGGAFRGRHGIDPQAPLLCVLPGSRMSEVERLMPVFGETLRLLGGRFSGLRAALPAVAPLADAIAESSRGWAAPVTVVRGEAEKRDAFAAADAALAASGTVTLELALAGVPMVVAYRMHPATVWLARRLVSVKHVSLVNLILDRGAVPELLLEACRPPALADAVERLLGDEEGARREQVAAFREALRLLGRGGEPPSRKAAAVILGIIAKGENR